MGRIFPLRRYNVKTSRLTAAVGGTPAIFYTLNRHCVQRRLKGNEEDAWDGACAEALVGSFGGTVRISEYVPPVVEG